MLNTLKGIVNQVMVINGLCDKNRFLHESPLPDKIKI